MQRKNKRSVVDGSSHAVETVISKCCPGSMGFVTRTIALMSLVNVMVGDSGLV